MSWLSREAVTQRAARSYSSLNSERVVVFFVPGSVLVQPENVMSVVFDLFKLLDLASVLWPLPRVGESKRKLLDWIYVGKIGGRREQSRQEQTMRMHLYSSIFIVRVVAPNSDAR